jgi:hypothetical protein
MDTRRRGLALRARALGTLSRDRGTVLDGQDAPRSARRRARGPACLVTLALVAAIGGCARSPTQDGPHAEEQPLRGNDGGGGGM